MLVAELSAGSALSAFENLELVECRVSVGVRKIGPGVSLSFSNCVICWYRLETVNNSLVEVPVKGIARTILGVHVLIIN